MSHQLTKEERVMAAHRKAFQRWMMLKDYICHPDTIVNQNKRGEHRNLKMAERYTKI